MNEYRVYVKKTGEYERIDGSVVYPFTTSNLLDERLDEAYVTVINSSVALYSPMTEMRIEIEDGATVKYYNMVVANDSPKKNLLTGRYDHSLYLVERTKILSGIICPSLTFTNDLLRKTPPYFLPVNADYRWTPAESDVELPPDIMGAVSMKQSRLQLYGSQNYQGYYKNKAIPYVDGFRYLNYGVCLPYEAYTDNLDIMSGRPVDLYNVPLVEYGIADGVSPSDISAVGGESNARLLWPKVKKTPAIPRFLTLANVMAHFTEAKESTTDGQFKGHYIRIDWSYINVKINNRLYAILVDAYNPATKDYNGQDFAITPTPDIGEGNYTAPSDFLDDPAPPFDYMGNWTTGFYYDNGETNVQLTRETYRTPVFTIPENDVSNDDVVTFEYVLMYVNTTGTSAGKNPSNKYTFTYSVSAIDPDGRSNKEYDVKECIDRVLMLAEPIKKGGTPRFSLNASQGVELGKKAAPEFSMTQNTLREQLKLIGSYIHAEPRLDVDDVVYFDDYTPGKKANIKGKLIENSASWDVNNYATDLKSNVQNLVSTGGYASAKTYQQGIDVMRSVRAETTYARLTDGNVTADTQFPIYGIEAVKCRFDYGAYSDKEWDVTAFVYESSQYNILSSWTTVYTRSKAYALYYTIGEKSIKGITYNAKELAEQALNQRYAISNIIGACEALSSEDTTALNEAIQQNFTKLKFNIVYRPIYPSFISHGKGIYNTEAPKYSKLHNQSENFIESRSFGENMKGTAERTGNPDVLMTFILPSLADIPKPGYIYNDMVISAVDVEVYAYSIKCTVSLTKEFNRLSQYIGLSSVKRMYQISERQVSNRDILIHNTIVACEQDSVYQPNENAPTLTTNSRFWQGIAGLFNGVMPSLPVSCAVAECSSDDGTNGPNRLTDVLLPVVPSAFGNSIAFYFSYEDNYSAGTEATSPAQSSAALGGTWTNAVQYPDNKGFAQYLTYYLINDTSDVSEWGSAANLPRLNDLFTPSLAIDYSPSYLNDENALTLLKDNREKISITTEYEFKSDIDGMVIGSAMSMMCPLVSSALREQFIEQNGGTHAKLWAIIDPAAVPSKFATTIDPENNGFSEISNAFTVNVTNSGVNINTNYVTSQKIYGWIITTPSDLKEETYRDIWTNEDVTVTEERGYRILLLSTKEVNPGERIFPQDGIFFKLLNE